MQRPPPAWAAWLAAGATSVERAIRAPRPSFKADILRIDTSFQVVFPGGIPGCKGQLNDQAGLYRYLALCQLTAKIPATPSGSAPTARGSRSGTSPARR